MKLSPDEVDLVGQWLQSGDTVEPDAICKRIQFLTSGVLEPMATSADGWDTLYRDPVDLRFWECTYPGSETHGGGPPRLSVITEVDAAAKYPHRWMSRDVVKSDSSRSNGGPFHSVEEALAFVEAATIVGSSFELPIADGLTFLGAPDVIGAGMAVLFDAILAKGYEPDGFELRNGYRIYRYKTFE